jgi:PPE-SVP subfamily C-terminal region
VRSSVSLVARARLGRPVIGAGRLGIGHSGAKPGRRDLPISSITVAPETGAAGGNLLGGMPLACAGNGTHDFGPKYRTRPTVMPRHPFAG